MTARPRLLIIDDDEAVPLIVGRVAAPLGFAVESRANGADGLVALTAWDPDVALVDLQMPGLGGLDVLRAVRAADPECQVILMTGNATLDSAIEAVKAGALDYLTKPFDFERLKGLLVGVRDGIHHRERIMTGDAAAAGQLLFHGMIGRAPAMEHLFDAIRRLAPHVRTILITGETGTGKELVAKALHVLGRRRDKRFVTVNCSAVVATLFESELFGHVRGAFTGATETKGGLFEHASGGTLFLDEAGELPLPLQAKLLRAVEYGEIQRVGSLESRRVDVAVIAATNRDLRVEAAAGRFRPDLFYRLSLLEVHIPPLRERREDIPYLTAAFVRECAQRLQRPITGLTVSAERLLQEAPWPGNVRELRNVIERACILTDKMILSERELTPAIAGSSRDIVPALPASGPDGLRLSTAQRDQVRRALRQTGGNKTAAAKLLGMSRRSIYRWVERLDLED